MKKTLLLCLTLCISLCAHTQATDLVVDCQTPGWLSSKINYGDQQTVKNLKVTGYINNSDLAFIGTLISSRSLNGELDLSECNIVGETADKDNVLNGLGASGKLNVYRIPKSAIEVNCCTGSLYVENLYFDCNLSIVSVRCLGGEDTHVDNLYIGDNIEEIEGQDLINSRAGWGFTWIKGIKSVCLPKKIKRIGDCAFYYSSLNNVNFNELEELESLGAHAFRHTGVRPDTIVVSAKLKEFNASSFSYHSGQHIFIGKNVKKIAVGADLKFTYGFGDDLIFHMESTTPPLGHRPNSTCTVYVPKGAKTAYVNAGWSNIIEMNPVENVVLNEHSIFLNKTEQFNLSVSILPEDADDKNINWTSEDTSIATVDENGVVTAIKEGQTEIVVTSTSTGIQDRCVVVVRKNVTGVELEESQITFSNVGDSKQLIAIITPEDATEQGVTWKSSNESICTVTDQGLITATGIGSTLVTVTTVDGGLTANCVVKVIQHVSSISLDKTTLTLKVGETDRLQATISPDNADNKKVNWSSSNEQLATVDAEGNVQALKAGDVWITATSDDNSEIKASCKVTIKQPVTEISLSQTNIELNNIGESVQLEATIMPEDASDKSIAWKSNNESICTVTDQGLITATGIGSTLVTVTTVDGGLTANCVVKVIQHVSSISLDKTALTLKVGETDRLQAIISPDNADNKKVNWSSSNEQLATVDVEGNVQALKAGDVWITATSDDNSEIKASCKVTIKQPVTEISLSQTNIELNNIGESVQLEATIMPEDASDKSVTWKSNNEQVCIVSSTGMVTAIGAGTTVVTATTNDGEKMAFCIVNVSLQEYNITLDQYTMTLNVGETAQLHATVTGNTTKTVNWSSSNDQIVTVDNNGNVTAIKVGNALIYATLADLPDVQTSCAVAVNEVDGILEILGESVNGISIYNLSGHRITQPQRGLNIIRKSDGTTSKVVVK